MVANEAAKALHVYSDDTSADQTVALPAGGTHHDRGCASMFDIAGMSDRHFAISEEAVDRSRHAYEGNWVADGHARFQREHGHMIECPTEAGEASDSDVADGNDDEHALCCPGICCKQIEKVQDRFDCLWHECVALLRMLRTARREKGYQPHHGLLVVMQSGSNAVLELHVLGRISFSPFDFTACEFRPCRDVTEHMQATLHVSAGVAVLRTMKQLLYKLALQDDAFLGTADFQAISLGSIRILPASGRPLSVLATGPHGVAGIRGAGNNRVAGDDSDNEERFLDKCNMMLKRALGSVGAGAVKAKAKPACAKRRTTSKPAKPKCSMPADAGAHAHEKIDHEIEVTWSDAMLAGLGSHDDLQPSRLSSGASGSRDPAPAAPVQATRPAGIPWKDDQGYAFVMVPGEDGSLKQKHLGTLSSITQCM